MRGRGRHSATRKQSRLAGAGALGWRGRRGEGVGKSRECQSQDGAAGPKARSGGVLPQAGAPVPPGSTRLPENGCFRSQKAQKERRDRTFLRVSNAPHLDPQHRRDDGVQFENDLPKVTERGEGKATSVTCFL